MEEKKSDKKRELILAGSRRVFRRKGFAAVTMKDIIEECGISRGGIYLYFSSVDEIFIKAVQSHNDNKLRETQASVHEDKSFKQLIDDYFERQKIRFLNMQDSLLMAMHEYRFNHRSPDDKGFYVEQFLNTKAIILELLHYGVQTGDIEERNIEELAVHIMCFIEGISTMATTTGLSEEIINSQIDFVKNMIYNITRKA